MNHSGTFAVKGQATQGPAAAYVDSLAPLDMLCCQLTWIVGMGAMKIPDSLAVVGTLGSIADWETQS